MTTHRSEVPALWDDQVDTPYTGMVSSQNFARSDRFRYPMGAGRSFRNTTARTTDIHSTMEYGTSWHCISAKTLWRQSKEDSTMHGSIAWPAPLQRGAGHDRYTSSRLWVFFCLVCRAGFRRFTADMNEPICCCLQKSTHRYQLYNVVLELLELDVAQCGAWLCQLRNCRWKNFSLQGLRQMGDIWKRVQISWAWTTASKLCLSWLWIDWHSFIGTDLWYGPWLIDGWFDGWIDSLPDWLRDVITLPMKNRVGLDYHFAWTFFCFIYKASLQTGWLRSQNLWSQTCVHCWYSHVHLDRLRLVFSISSTSWWTSASNSLFGTQIMGMFVATTDHSGNDLSWPHWKGWWSSGIQ